MFLIFFIFSLANGASINSCMELFKSESIIYQVHISKLRPTQMEIGGVLVDIRAKELLQQAEEKGLSPHQFVLKYRAPKLIPAVISPRGEFFTTDSHHGIAIIYKMLGKAANVKLAIKVVRDYRAPKSDGTSWSYEEFIINLQTPVSQGGLAKGQFSKDVKAKGLEARFAYLPSRYDKLQNNPLRSLVGAALGKRGIAAEDYKDYIEFDIADMVDGKAFADLAFTEERINQVANYIFSNAEIMQYLFDNHK